MDKKEFGHSPRGKQIVLSPEHHSVGLTVPEAIRFPSDRLDSWKAIANHLGREVRTVQLWEKLEGLPVHRHFHRKLGSVFAYRSEVDAWREGTSRASGAMEGHKRVMIAVLPFESLGGNPEQECFHSGITIEIITALTSLAP